MKGVKRNKKLSAIFPGKLIVQTIALRSYFAVAEANTYIKICNGFLALINLWLITNKEFHLPPKAAKQLFRNNYRRVEFSNLRAAEKQPIRCLYTRPRKKGKKNWRVKSWLRRTLPPSPPTFSLFAGSNDKKNSQVLLFVEGVKQKKFISLWSATKKCSSLKNEEQNI